MVIPQTLPRRSCGLRLTLGPAWLFLIAAEAIAATDGLGYRIFLVRRYLAMDVILPYVAWITLLAYAHGPHAGGARPALVPVGRGQQRMSGLDVNGLWLRYGATPVLERVELHVPAGELVHHRRARRAAARPASCACCWGSSNPRAGRFCWTASRCRRAGAASAAWCSSATRSIRT